MKNIIRSITYGIIDLFTFYRGVPRTINGFKILFPARFSRYYRNGYENDTFDFFKREIKKGDTVLDIGAHIGLYTRPLSELTGETGKVFSFEPTPTTFAVLKKTIMLNKLHNVVPVNAAISNVSGTVTFNLTSKNGEASNANSMVEIDRTQTHIKVKSYSIDDFREQHKLNIAILKIDVEGAELLALKGAEKTFNADRPAGILALHPANIIEFGHSLEEIWDCLMDYRLQISYKNKTLTKETFCANTLLFDVEFKPLS